MSWKKLLLLIASVINWRTVLLISVVLVLIGAVLGIGIRLTSSLPNGFYSIGLVKPQLPPWVPPPSRYLNRNTPPDIFLTGAELTDEATVILVECVDDDEDRMLASLESATLSEDLSFLSNILWSPNEYHFLRSEPLTFREPLLLPKGQRVTVRFYFERVSSSPVNLVFKYQLKNEAGPLAAHFTLKE